MLVGVTGATGFVGTYLCRALSAAGHSIRGGARKTSDTAMLEEMGAEIYPVNLANKKTLANFVFGCDAVIHAAADFSAAYNNQMANIEANVLGSLRLLEYCRQEEAQFIFISSGAVHDRILGDRPLDEAHPLWPATTYGAYKAAVEAFLPAYHAQFHVNGSAYRPTYIYGLNPLDVRDSHWYRFVEGVIEGRRVETRRGGKVVFIDDVVEVLTKAIGRQDVAGEAYELTDCHIYDQQVAQFAKEAARVDTEIVPLPLPGPKHQIVSDKARKTFGVGLNRGHEGVRRYVEELVRIIRGAEAPGGKGGKSGKGGKGAKEKAVRT